MKEVRAIVQKERCKRAGPRRRVPGLSHNSDCNGTAQGNLLWEVGLGARLEAGQAGILMEGKGLGETPLVVVGMVAL